MTLVMMMVVVLVVGMMMVAVVMGHVLRRLGRGRCLGERRRGEGGEHCCNEQRFEGGGGHGGDSVVGQRFVWAPNLSSAPGFGRACA